jgi:hypothetical protein
MIKVDSLKRKSLNIVRGLYLLTTVTAVILAVSVIFLGKIS